VSNGDVDFDHSDPWQLIGTTREPDVLGAAIHELGHSLGLTHSDIEGSNLYWIFRRFAGPGTGELHPDDLAAITTLYGTGRGSVTPLVRIPEPTSVALALGGVVALLALRRRSSTERVGFRGP
jgi:MYXO-CTERM domain-containing protein